MGHHPVTAMMAKVMEHAPASVRMAPVRMASRTSMQRPATLRAANLWTDPTRDQTLPACTAVIRACTCTLLGFRRQRFVLTLAAGFERWDGDNNRRQHRLDRIAISS